MGTFKRLLTVALVWVFLTSATEAQDLIRVATYNIQNLDTNATDERNLQHVVRLLDADVVELQEIRDRAALQRVLIQAAQVHQVHGG